MDFVLALGVGVCGVPMAVGVAAVALRGIFGAIGMFVRHEQAPRTAL